MQHCLVGKGQQAATWQPPPLQLINHIYGISTLILHQTASVIFHWVLHVTQGFGLWSVVWISSFVADSQHKFMPLLLQALFLCLLEQPVLPAVRLAASFSFYLLLQLFLVQIPRSKIKTIIQAIVALLLLFSYEHGQSISKLLESLQQNMVGPIVVDHSSWHV